MSRDSGAGAYSHGIAWPSPRPQLDVVPADAGTMLDAVSVAMIAIMSPGRRDPAEDASGSRRHRDTGGGSVPIGLSRATAATTANGTSNGSRSTVAAHP